MSSPSEKQACDILLLMIPNWHWPPYLASVATLQSYLQDSGIQTVYADPVSEFISERSADLKEEFFSEFNAMDHYQFRRMWDLPESAELWEKLKQTIELHRPRLLAFSVIVGNHIPSLYFAWRFKKEFPSLPIILGGPFVTALLSGLIKYPGPLKDLGQCADYMIQGEGEITLKELFLSLAQSKKVAQIEGLAYFANDSWYVNKERAPLENLADFPLVRFDAFRGNPYFEKHYHNHLPLTFSRGCPFNCSFCTIHKYNPGHRHYSLEKSLKYLKEMNPTEESLSVSIIDPICNADPVWLKKWCLGVELLNIKILWGACFRLMPQMTLPGYWDLPRKSGLVQVTLGLESASPSVLAHMGKLSDRKIIEDIFRSFADARKSSSLPFVVSLQLIVGYPTETEKDFNETLSFLEEYREFYDEIHTCSSFLLEPTTKVFERVSSDKSLKLVYENPSKWSTTHSTPQIRMERMKRIQDFFHRQKLNYRGFYVESLKKVNSFNSLL